LFERGRWPVDNRAERKNKDTGETSPVSVRLGRFTALGCWALDACLKCSQQNGADEYENGEDGQRIEPQG
jgi:hypothetical protein